MKTVRVKNFLYKKMSNKKRWELDENITQEQNSKNGEKKSE